MDEPRTCPDCGRTLLPGSPKGGPDFHEGEERVLARWLRANLRLRLYKMRQMLAAKSAPELIVDNQKSLVLSTFDALRHYTQHEVQ